MTRCRSIFILALLLPLSLLAQPKVTVSGPAGNIKAGTSFQLTISLSGSAASGDEALQFSLSNVLWPTTITASPQLTALGKTVTCANVGQLYNCIVFGMNSTMLTDMTLATMSIAIPKTAPTGTFPMALSNLLAAMDTTTDIVGGPLSASLPFLASIINVCDINGDGAVNATDSNILAQQVLGVSACNNDLTSDGKCDIVDLQILSKAVATGVCSAK